MPVLLDHREIEVARQIRVVMQAAYTVEANLLVVEDFFPLRRTARQISDASSCFLGIFEASTLVAVAEIELEHADRLDIAALVVLPTHFRRGLATTLLEFLFHSYADRAFIVSTGAANQPALQLYERLGFRTVRRWQTNDGIPMRTLSRPCPTVR